MAGGPQPGAAPGHCSRRLEERPAPKKGNTGKRRPQPQSGGSVLDVCMLKCRVGVGRRGVKPEARASPRG